MLKRLSFCALLFPLGLLFSFSFTQAQTQSFDVDIRSENFIGQDNLPFYAWANRQGMIPVSGVYSLWTAQASARGRWEAAKKPFSVEGGFKAFHSKGDVEKTKLVELFGKVNTKYAAFTGGWYADTIQQQGLSVSNGNFMSGLNAEPFFCLKMTTNGFIPIGKKNFSVAALWEEGLMGDNNYVKDTRWHHKNLFLRFGKPERLQFTWGLEQYALWGGNSPSRGKQPDSFEDYIRTFFSLPGGKNANESDQMNAQGNQLGQHYLIFIKTLERHSLEARIVHPLEDFSGLVFINAPDNLYSLSVYFHEWPVIDRIVTEFYYTKHQSGSDIDKKTGQYRHRNGRDNYFNHGTYSFGYTQNGYVIGSPLFYPLNIGDGQVMGVNNNRFWAFHTGVSGAWINRMLEWKLMGTWSRNFGTYSKPFEPARDQLSTYAEAKFNLNNFPLWISLSFALDNGDLMTGEKQNLTALMLNAGLRFKN
ncbi:MAG: capsule assembly Wzi family protein [Prolixibacteraceae bacterium]|nr:capsule assembly Wzi family protein [Prolixibacteraceae bacterium]